MLAAGIVGWHPAERASPMSDFKCVACRIRTRHTGDTPRSVGDPCPGCGSPLELVGRLAEVVGYRPVSTADRLVDSDAPVAVSLPTANRRLVLDAGAPGENRTR